MKKGFILFSLILGAFSFAETTGKIKSELKPDYSFNNKATTVNWTLYDVEINNDGARIKSKIDGSNLSFKNVFNEFSYGLPVLSLDEVRPYINYEIISQKLNLGVTTAYSKNKFSNNNKLEYKSVNLINNPAVYGSVELNYNFADYFSGSSKTEINSEFIKDSKNKEYEKVNVNVKETVKFVLSGKISSSSAKLTSESIFDKSINDLKLKLNENEQQTPTHVFSFTQKLNQELTYPLQDNLDLIQKLGGSVSVDLTNKVNYEVNGELGLKFKPISDLTISSSIFTKYSGENGNKGNTNLGGFINFEYKF